MENGQNQTFERRMSPRVELRGLTGLPEKPGLARIIDISASGAQVEFHSRLVPGNVYEMTLTFPDRKILARVMVTRSMDLYRSMENGDEVQSMGALAGLEFKGLDPEDRRYLEHYVAGLAEMER